MAANVMAGVSLDTMSGDDITISADGTKIAIVLPATTLYEPQID